MAWIFISIGSNEERAQRIRAARKALAQSYGELMISSVYESEAVGFDGPAFYNLVIGAQTQETPAEVDARLKVIEQENGRIRHCAKFSNRKLDLDLLLYDERVQSQGPTLPRPEITENAFVLWPLAELVPERVHPLTQKTYADLWRDYDKEQQLQKIDFLWSSESLQG